MKKLVALFLALIMTCTAVSALAATPAVYKVEDANGNMIYLFGTIHMVKQDVYEMEMPFGAAAEQAYTDADILAVELDVYTQLQEMKAGNGTASADDMYYMDGTTVLDHGVTEETLNGFSAALGIPVETLMHVKLSYWSTLMLIPVVMELQMDMENGVDAYLLQRAHADGKIIHELETNEEQNAVLSSLSDEAVLASVNEFVQDPMSTLKKSLESMENLYQGWSTGNEEMLLSSLTEESQKDSNLSEDYETFEQRLSSDRDDQFVQDAIGYLARGEKALIAIGALHIVGETGLVNQLTDAGYTVTKISE